MPVLNFECEKGHQFEAEYTSDRIPCQRKRCKSTAEILWVAASSPHRQFQTPIVMWKYADGSLGVAGGANSHTPPNAERIEIRSGMEYRKHVNELNRQRRGVEERREERYQEVLEYQTKQAHSNLNTLMANESDPYARDLYREALARSSGGHQKLPYSDFYSVVMENDRSNYEG